MRSPSLMTIGCGGTTVCPPLTLQQKNFFSLNFYFMKSESEEGISFLYTRNGGGEPYD